MVLLIFTLIWCMIMSGMVVSAVVIHDYLLLKDYDIPQTDSEIRTVMLYARIHEANEKYFPTPKQKPADKLAKLRQGLR